VTTAVAVVLLLAIVAYTALGGADFGAGFWELTASEHHGDRPRRLIDHAIAPVWEANHVWLVFVLVILWTGFPEAYASIMLTLFVPLTLVALGIVMRGSGFAFRKAIAGPRVRRNLGRVFALSSLLVPYCMGAVAGGIASGRVPAGGKAGDPVDSWINPTSAIVGVLAIAVGAYLSAVYLVWDARRLDDAAMVTYFRQRAIVAAVVAGAVAVAGAFVLHDDAHYVFHGLTSRALPLVLLSAVSGVVALALLLRAATGGARALAALAVAAVVGAWGVAQWPYLLPTSLKFSAAAAPSSTLTTILVVFGIVLLVVLPSLVLLLVLDQKNLLPGEGVADATGLAAAALASRRKEEAMTEQPLHRVVIVGGGFGGLFAARFLKRAAVHVTLIDRVNYHLFQPLLYQLATGILSEGQVAPPIRGILRKHKNVDVEFATVTAFDLVARTVTAKRPDDFTQTHAFDSLIVAAGAGQSYFGHDEFSRFAPGMKTIDDALELKARIFGAFELAESEPDEAARRSWLTFVVVGGGPTGVEIAGQIAELSRSGLKRNFRRIDPASAQVILFDGGKEILASFGDNLSQKASKELKRLGVQIRTGSIVTDVDPLGVMVKRADGSTSRVDARIKIWAAGVAASPLARLLAEASGAPTDRAGRVEVLPDCSLPGHPEVFAVGDMMALNRLPGVAEVAMQSGIHAANTIKRRLDGKQSVPFKYRDLGSMATVSRFRAIVSFKGIRLSGFAGWLVWLAVHLTFLTGFKNRLAALLHWTNTFIGGGRAERAITVRQAMARVAIDLAGGEEALRLAASAPASARRRDGSLPGDTSR